MKTSNFKHLMVDLETMGTTSYSAIMSIAAVEFNMDGSTGRTFYENVDLQSCLDLGLTIDAKTLTWWFSQSQGAWGALFENTPNSIQECLIRFRAFLDEDQQIWGNSASFDLGLLANAYEKVKIPVPWKFSKERDVRTLVSFAPEIKKSMPFQGVPHNALDDCYHQIAYCSAIWQEIDGYRIDKKSQLERESKKF